MAEYPSRRTSSAQAAPSIPPPPPLPPAKQHGASTRSYFSRFVTQPFTTYGSRPPSAQANRPDGGRPNPLVPRLPGVSSGSSQDASHKTGLEISALDINRERTHAILAGREILKTIRINDAKCAEDINLRAAIIQYAAHNTSGPGATARHRETLEIHDVKWSHGQFSTHIATAATNGKVILYDLNRAGMELARLHEHHRQVHKVAFNPHQGYLLLSGSQDATVRLWDLRDMRKDAMTCLSRDKYSGLSEGVRDLQWSPTDGVEFAFGTDNGVIQRWDFRNNRGPKLKINAHDKICNSIDWHPDGKHLLSASNDKTVRVWDFSSEVRRQKPAFVLRTPHPVLKARWRPPCWTEEFYEQGAYQCTQLATSYDREHPVVHLWDFRRPFLPFREINCYSSAPSDMLWHSRDFLWAVGREGVFTQTDVHFSPKVVDRRNMQAFAVSPSGEISGFAQKRPGRRRSGLEYSADDTYISDSREKRSSPEKNSLRSSADDSVDESFLSLSFRRHHGRSASNRSTKSFGSTPPSETAAKVMFLTDSMALHSDSFKPNQIAFRGILPGSTSIQIFTYLAQKYKTIPLPDPPTLDAFNDLQRAFEQNAEYAQRAAFYRLAETWRVVGASISMATRRRAEVHRKRRLDRKRLTSSNSQPQAVIDCLAHNRQHAVTLNPAARAIFGTDREQPQGASESTSNLATPLARPFPGSETRSGTGLPPLPDPDHDEDLNLPPAAVGPHSTSDAPVSSDTANKSLALNRPSFNGPHWFNSSNDLDERRAMIGSWRAPPRAPLSLDPPNTQGININIPPRLDRHDSDESFAMFSASTDSQRAISMPSSFASGKSQPRSMDSIPENWRHPPIDSVDSSFGNGNRPTQLGNLLNQKAESNDAHAESLGRSIQFSPMAVPFSRDNVPRQGSQVQSTNEAILAAVDHNGSVPHIEQDKAMQDMETLRKNNQLLRHDSSESEAYLSSRGDHSENSAEYAETMEASGTIVPEDAAPEELRSPHAPKPPPSLPHATESAPAALDPNADEPIILADYQATELDVQASESHGLSFPIIDLLKQILSFHTSNLSDAQTSSIMLLLLTPLLPRIHSLDRGNEIDTTDVLNTYADQLNALGMTPTQTQTILSTHVTQLLQTGLNPYQAESILTTYHTQLHSLSLFNAAASLRRLAYPIYPTVYEQALKDTQLGLLCLSCNTPINNPRDKMRCETCKRAQAPCPICWGRYPAFEGVAAKKKAKLRASPSPSTSTSTSKSDQYRRKRSSLLTMYPLGDADTATAAAAAAAAAARGPENFAPENFTADATAAITTTDTSTGTSTAAAAAGGLTDDEVLSPSAPEPMLDPRAVLWTWCPLCGHGGHTACLGAWFADPNMSDGACATEGCLCDCVRGRRREDRLREAQGRKAERERGRVVRGDEWKVGESRAVVGARGALGELGGAAVAGRREGGEGRRVRVVEPGDDGGLGAGGGRRLGA